MPGDMIGEYTKEELAAMSREDFDAAQAREFAKPGADPTVGDRGGINLGSSVRRAEPSSKVWASKKSSAYDFTAPSGQTCRLHRLAPEKLLEAGILDKVTVLEALAAKLVDTAEGNPPNKSAIPSTEEFALLLETINLVIPMAVVEPVVYADSDPSPEGEEPIRVSDIDLDDRMAILNEALKGVTALSSFRNAR